MKGDYVVAESNIIAYNSPRDQLRAVQRGPSPQRSVFLQAETAKFKDTRKMMIAK
jgi:hypothetical protein